MISSCLNFVPTESWIKHSSGLPWLKLNLEVPVKEIEQEAKNLYPLAVSHRSQDAFGNYSHEGWKALTLYGKNSTNTIDSDGPLIWTDVVDSCPVTVNFIKKYWDITDSTGRIRFMYLDPNGYILPHTDRDTKGLFEINVAITNPDGCMFRFLDYGTVPFVPGSAFHVDISNKHFVANQSDKLRIHIIVHSSLKQGILKSSYEQNFYR